MNQFSSTPTFSAELPYSNTFNSHCDICSHPISESDVNVLQPCCCGPFHGYCITNLELQTRDSDPNNSNPQLTCPRCRQLVTAVNYRFLHHFPRASRSPFTTTAQPFLPIAIHDTASLASNPSNNPKSSSYTNTPKAMYNQIPQTPHTTPIYPKPTPQAPHTTPLSAYPKPTPFPPIHAPSPYHLSPYRPPRPDFIPSPSAPPLSHDHTTLPRDIHECFPPPLQEFKPSTSKNTQPTPRVSKSVPHSSTRRRDDFIHLPTPNHEIPPSPLQHNNKQRRHYSFSQPAHTHSSPNTIVIQVPEEHARKTMYRDDVYKVDVQGKAKVVPPTDPSNTTTNMSTPRQKHVKVEMDLHVYHHYAPFTRPTKEKHKEKHRRKSKPADKIWWKSSRTPSRLHSRQEHHTEQYDRGRGGFSRRS